MAQSLSSQHNIPVMESKLQEFIQRGIRKINQQTRLEVIQYLNWFRQRVKFLLPARLTQTQYDQFIARAQTAAALERTLWDRVNRIKGGNALWLEFRDVLCEQDIWLSFKLYATISFEDVRVYYDKIIELSISLPENSTFVIIRNSVGDLKLIFMDSNNKMYAEATAFIVGTAKQATSGLDDWTWTWGHMNTSGLMHMEYRDMLLAYTDPADVELTVRPVSHGLTEKRLQTYLYQVAAIFKCDYATPITSISEIVFCRDFTYKRDEQKERHVLNQMSEEKSESKGVSSRKICSVCGKPSKSKCSVCRAVRYCSKECQVRDWPTHKLNCSRLDPLSETVD
jgi:hypothetical protein